jgi:tetratricopeptide (TPR) repeat protein
MTGLDWVLALGVVALGFLIASFSITNSDFFMHLATGRLIAEGNYSFGKDPFSFVGADRTWVNHAWLWDLGLFLLYKSAGGPALVVVKALAVAIAAGLLLLARRPQFSIWPNVVCTGLALLAAAPRFIMNPVIATYVAVAVLMYLLIRVPKRGWGFPIAIAVLFCLWSNSDSWFILGPIALLLYTVGHFIRPREGDETATLLKGLGLGLVACMIHPHHVQVWQLPAEAFNIGLTETFKGDAELSASVSGAFSRNAFDWTGDRQNPVNLYSLVLLLVLAVAGFLLNLRQLSFGLLLVWFGTIALVFAHSRSTPILAFVTAPIAALNLAEFGWRFGQKPRSASTIRGLNALRLGGRGMTALVGLLLIALSYPGWLQPFSANRRWKWEIEPNASMERVANRIHEWRTSGKLPEEARLLNIQPDVACYIAWYAPGQKTYFDFRFQFHEPEATDYKGLRQFLYTPRPKEQFPLQEFLSKNDVTYAITAHPSNSINQSVLTHLWLGGNLLKPSDWILWGVEGRGAILGWTAQKTIPVEKANGLAFAPMELAFHKAIPLPSPILRQPIIEQSIWDRYVATRPTSPPEIEEAFVLSIYRGMLISRAEAKVNLAKNVQRFTVFKIMEKVGRQPSLDLWAALMGNINVNVPNQEEVISSGLLSIQAARRAVVASPDHPDGYYYLGLIYSEASLMGPDDAMTSAVNNSNIARSLIRLPATPNRTAATFDVYQAASKLRDIHAGVQPPRIDMALDAFKLARDYLDLTLQEIAANSGSLSEAQSKEYDQLSMRFENMEKAILDGDTEIKRRSDAYINASGRMNDALSRAALASQYGLAKEALAELYKEHQNFQSVLQDEARARQISPTELGRQFALHGELIELLLMSGRAEEAADIVETFSGNESQTAMKSQEVIDIFIQSRINSFTLKTGQQIQNLPPDVRQGVLAELTQTPLFYFRNLRRMTALITGQFDKLIPIDQEIAQDARRQLKSFETEMLPKGVQKMHDARVTMAYTMLGQPTAVPLAVIRTFAQANAIGITMNRYSQLAYGQAKSHYNLAISHLEAGEPKKAAEQFRESIKGPDAPGVNSIRSSARNYLKFMGEAAPE